MTTKTTIRCTLIALAIAISHPNTVARAQQNDQKAKEDAKTTEESGVEDKPVVEFAETYNRRFAGRKPTVGEPLPEAGGFDEQGRAFELAATRGNYTVLVFGCLT